ncbi:MAG: hypothetical protein FWC78_06845 [Defluviitaleaceae bacterium]|nr:hypothetical protein [Defluviitaleaceae bacterium]
MEDIFKLLNRIRESPVFYFGGRESLPLLRAYICGYAEKQWELDNDSTLTFALYGFQQFVQKKYGFGELTPHCWSKIIDFHSSSDREAFETFYKLLDEFLENRCDNEEKSLDG